MSVYFAKRPREDWKLELSFEFFVSVFCFVLLASHMFFFTPTCLVFLPPGRVFLSVPNP